jgi:hypothetical protein
MKTNGGFVGTWSMYGMNETLSEARRPSDDAGDFDGLLRGDDWQRATGRGCLGVPGVDGNSASVEDGSVPVEVNSFGSISQVNEVREERNTYHVDQAREPSIVTWASDLPRLTQKQWCKGKTILCSRDQE